MLQERIITKIRHIDPELMNGDSEPIRSELFSIERFDEHARSLALAQTVTDNPRVGTKLTPRLKDNSRVLRDSYQFVTQALKENRAITPAAEWLLDSFHLVEEQLREIKTHLPQDFYDELPKLSSSFLKGLPRIYGLAWAYVAHTDSRFESEVLVHFVHSYQQVEPLTSGELWSIAITLRIVMIENLRRTAVLIIRAQQARESADALVDGLLGLHESSPAEAYAVLEDLTAQPVSDAFLVQLIQRLRYQDPTATPAVNWLNEKLLSMNQSADEIVSRVHRIQAASNLTVRNIITSFRSMSAYDWPEFFESVSLVQKDLLGFSGFSEMDFLTRDSYRHAIEDLAKGSRNKELQISALLKRSESDPGQVLFFPGRLEFEKDIKYRPGFKQRILRTFSSHPTLFFLGSITVTTAVLLSLPFYWDPTASRLWLLVLFGVLPASDVAVSLVNRLVTEMIGPKHLPRLEFEDGPPERFRTFVIVPTLLGDEDSIHRLVEQLEVHYLSNSDGDVRFALLTDWTDALQEKLDADSDQFELATLAIDELNEKHGKAPDGGPRFFLYHRRRRFNPSEGKWIGWERKRGKIHEFNRLLRGATDTTYITIANRQLVVPKDVRYVITLDADTKLPKGSVSQLVGTLAHPLNQAQIDPKLNRVVKGYGVLQPRVTAALPARGESSLFQRLFSGECGIDPYAFAVSDVYQDLFGEGSYMGKGIYEVDTFETTLKDRIPENALLSHDLFEGSFARSGFVSDIELFEDFPSHSEVSSARNHRWIRGDWQLLPWIFGRKGWSLSLISRWKMLDNLRRSLVPLGSLGVLVVAICSPNIHPLVWIVFILLSIAIPPFSSFLVDVIPRGRRVGVRDHLSETHKDFVLGLWHFWIRLFLLAHHAWLYSDAVVRALFRLFISKKNLLEWVTAAQAKSSSSLTYESFIQRLKGSVFVAIGFFGVTYYFNPRALVFVVPFCAMWLLAPFAARLISLPPRGQESLPLSAEEILRMKEHSRRIWRFFATFVTSKDHFLPPDNFQEDPVPVLAHRSSPTNFGLYLLSIVAANDFGWSSGFETAERLEATLDSMLKLPRYRGHFYNWYETEQFCALDPKYISSVDSGNLAGHLLALSQSCTDLSRTEILSKGCFEGISDSARLLRVSFESLPGDRRSSPAVLDSLNKAIAGIEQKLATAPASNLQRLLRWYELAALAENIHDIATVLSLDRGDGEAAEVVEWSRWVLSDIQGHCRQFDKIVPFFLLFEASSNLFQSSFGDNEIWRSIEELFSEKLHLNELPETCGKAIVSLERLHSLCFSRMTPDETVLFDQILESFEMGRSASTELVERFSEISAKAKRIFHEMDFTFLFNQKKKLFSIGYRVLEGELDESSYDLLASEARLTSYVAIIKGDAPVSHWFRLGRALTPVEGGAVLISWSGSMFEYLMPSLVMLTPRGSLLDQTCRLVVKRQIQYGLTRNVPWGVSESAYNIRDLQMTYQYSNFGVPGLGLKRGLANDLVVAPYATALAAMYDPQEALRNFELIEQVGGLGAYGFYEAMDYTSSRLRENQKGQIVRVYMAHHQGMALISFANVLHGGRMRNRFHSEPLVQAAELLLQERTPRNVGSVKSPMEEIEDRNVRDMVPPVIRRLTSPHHPIPSSHLLSNGRYAVMITAAGSGYSRWNKLAITRWREDVTRDCYGSFLYFRDLKSEYVWSATYHPTHVAAESSEIVFSEDRAKISRHDRFITSNLEIIISPEDDAELRRLSLTNTGTEIKEIEITSYSEVVLAPAEADRAHPSFSNLFVQTEYIAETATLLATRRPRAQHDSKPYMAQVLSVDAHTFGETEYETDRAKFIGRGHTLRSPKSIVEGRPLSKSVGAVLDPILSLRVKVRIAPGATARICLTTLAASNREEVLALAEKYRNPAAFERSSTLAWTQAQVRLHYLGITADEAEVFQKLANRVVYSDPMMRPAGEILKRNRLNITGLWGRGISGDLPIILVRIADEEDQTLVRQLLRAHEYWRMKRLAVDIVVLNEKPSSYVQELQNSLEAMVRGSLQESTDGPQGKVFVLRNDLLGQQEKELLLTVARAILDSRQGTLSEQVMKMRKVEAVRETAPKSLVETVTTGLRDRLRESLFDTLKDTLKAAFDYSEESVKQGSKLQIPKLQFFNGLGGFDPTTQEYVIVLAEGHQTPAPWINVISNPRFGFQVSESGAGYTWSLNSRENQITAWSNDPVLDSPTEAIFLTDVESGKVWSPTTSPIRVKDAAYLVRHGKGYSVFESLAYEVKTELTQYVSWNDPVKISKLVLENLSGETRRILITGYVEWVLGFSRTQTAPYIVTEWDLTSGAMLATNPLSIEFGERVSFFACVGAGEIKSHTGDRSEFLGRNGDLEAPAALILSKELTGRVGAGHDPCGVLQAEIELAPGERRELFLLLGQAENRNAARDLIRKYKGVEFESQFKQVVTHWDRILTKVQVETPDLSMNLLLNSWLLYQTMACRFWARAAFYQAGGAYGFRDQLQDVMAMVVAEPRLCREHILRAAGRQFIEGDVQHWWHPPTGRGVRTHFSDDLLWLPYTIVHYLSVTRDDSILNEAVSFIEGPLLTQEQEDSYFEPRISMERPTPLYEHCARALDRSLATGEHGLPLMGTGDWNDGMNRVGHLGKGESVWVAWFLHATLKSFVPLAMDRGDVARAEIWLEHAEKLRSTIEEKAWDGAWYRRAFFDDGTALGSPANAECKIDSIAQTWAILSGAGDPLRATQAMKSVEENLVRSEDQLILLFTPPFDHTALDPGYIKGYVPGVRENGGQYTHAAVWCICAYAASGNGNRATELFSMLNPIEHASTRAGAQKYKVEPYVMAADIYGEAPHVGRGGWTWYTGSSGWMYRAGTEYILGILPHGDFLELKPCVSPDWARFSVRYRHDTQDGSTLHEIQFENPKKVSRGIARIEVDGIVIQTESNGMNGFKLLNDQKSHKVKVILG